MKKMENRVLKATNKIENSCAFGAIRKGMVMLIPLLVVGYGALMIMSLPIAGYQDFIAHIWSGHVMDMLQFIYHGVNDIFAVLLAVTTSVSYALIKSRKKSGFEEKGERFVSVFTKMELDKLSVMYDGDKDRDATSKIRGFLFQDYVTIMCLLKNKVEYV